MELFEPQFSILSYWRKGDKASSPTFIMEIGGIESLRMRASWFRIEELMNIFKFRYEDIINQISGFDDGDKRVQFVYTNNGGVIIRVPTLCKNIARSALTNAWEQYYTPHKVQRLEKYFTDVQACQLG